MVSEELIKQLTQSTSYSFHQVQNVVRLIDEGATIPFMSRYRKEATGGMDEVQLADLREQYDKLCELIKRKATVLKSIEEQEKLTPELRQRIEECWNANELEDIYLPYKPKRRTRAEIAREKGLEPLAKIIMKQQTVDIQNVVNRFITSDVMNASDALQGARDIIAEWVNESEAARNAIRSIFSHEAIISSKMVKGKEEEAQKYRDYFDCSEKLSRCSSHRLLAMRRGESEGFLRVNITADDDKCIARLLRIFQKSDNECGLQVAEAVEDGYKRLLKPAIETEFAADSKSKADVEAIRVFAENLRQLLLAPPLGQKRVMGVDPGFRSGCKIVCLDAQGNLCHNENIYPHTPQNEHS